MYSTVCGAVVKSELFPTSFSEMIDSNFSHSDSRFLDVPPVTVKVNASRSMLTLHPNSRCNPRIVSPFVPIIAGIFLSLIRFEISPSASFLCSVRLSCHAMTPCLAAAICPSLPVIRIVPSSPIFVNSILTPCSSMNDLIFFPDFPMNAGKSIALR